MDKRRSKIKEENITNITLFLYLNRFSSLIVAKMSVEEKVEYNSSKYKKIKKDYRNDIKGIRTIDELPIKWLNYLEEAEEELVKNRNNQKCMN